jgi:hypothetical protein
MLLVDSMHAVHCGLAPNYSISELSIRMPSSNHQFRTIFNSLTHGYTLPQNVRSREDALLLLTALLEEIIYLQRCYLSIPFASSYAPGVVKGLSRNKETTLRNPYAPLCSESEYSRLSDALLNALARWEQHFQQQLGSDILALYYFTRLQLICPEIWELPHLAKYGIAAGVEDDSPNTFQHAKCFDVPDKAMDLAWLILDQYDQISKSAERRLSIWLPIVLFLSALVIWQKLQCQPSSNLKYGSLKVLSMFRNEIAQLPWPCCIQMAETLDRLMGKQTAPRKF